MTGPLVAIIGGGIGGASLAWHLSPHADVTLIEAETTPGYHTTGRSAAFFAQTYGGPDVQPLTTGSRDFLFAPPLEFCTVPLVLPRGALHVARAEELERVDVMAATFQPLTPSVTVVGPERIAALAPRLRPEYRAGAVHDPECRDIDVAALHTGFLAGARARGARLVTGARIDRLERIAGRWQLGWSAGRLEADIIVNAAGAWADEIALLAGAAPLGLSPRRRTIITFDPAPVPADPAAPLVLGIAGDFYFKPQGQRIWASPADETPSPPCDSQPEEIDKAITVQRIEAATDYRVRRIEHAWSGLRTFAPDRAPVYGFDAHLPGFFWCAGQGGFGIQTAPAAAELAAALLLGRAVPARLAALGIDADRYGPGRLRA